MNLLCKLRLHHWVPDRLLAHYVTRVLRRTAFAVEGAVGTRWEELCIRCGETRVVIYPNHRPTWMSPTEWEAHTKSVAKKEGES